MTDKLAVIRLNEPTARLYAKAGSPIARAGWSSTRWLTYENGAWWVTTSTTRSVVKATTLTAADFAAKDWSYPAGCVPAAQYEQADYPTTGATAGLPTFDVENPPCVV